MKKKIIFMLFWVLVVSIYATACQGQTEAITYVLAYSAGTGGTISGESIQTITAGNDGTAVTAVPDSGYAFDKWSDGLVTTTRQDTDVDSNIVVTAEFYEIAKENLIDFAGGCGTEESPYKISTAEQLTNIEKFPQAHYIIINDISLPAAGEGKSNFVPLCSDEKPFAGVLDGGGYKIENLTIISGYAYSGLFAYADKTSKVMNLSFIDVDIRASDYAGAVAGVSEGRVEGVTVGGTMMGLKGHESQVFLGGIAGKASGDIKNCRVSIDMGITDTDVIIAGGIVGVALSGLTISDCGNLGEVAIVSESSDVIAGGILGSSDILGDSKGGNINIINCYNTAEFNVVSTALISFSVGGIIGTDGKANITVNISGCYNKGAISVLNGGNAFGGAGGIAGSLGEDSIDNCYNTAIITASSGNRFGVGGIVGGGTSGGISNCYNTGDVKAVTDSVIAGGIAGTLTIGTLSNCHWLRETGDAENAVGYSESGQTPIDERALAYNAVFPMYLLADVLNEGQSQQVWLDKVEDTPILWWED